MQSLPRNLVISIMGVTATAPLPAALEPAQGKDEQFVDARETADERMSHVGDGGVDGKVPASSGDATALMSGLAELLREMKSKKDDEGKPRVKEADAIAIPDMPTPETYRQWKNLVRELVRSSSDKPDEAWEWIMEVWDPNLSRVELEAKLQNPGKFATNWTRSSPLLSPSQPAATWETESLTIRKSRRRREIKPEVEQFFSCLMTTSKRPRRQVLSTH